MLFDLLGHPVGGLEEEPLEVGARGAARQDHLEALAAADGHTQTPGPRAAPHVVAQAATGQDP